MGYSRSTYEEARRIIDERNSNAKKTAQYHTSEVYAKLPEIRDIDRELAATMSELAIAITEGSKEIKEKVEVIKNKNLMLQDKRKQLLLSAGYPENYTKVNYYCTKCDDTGFTITDKCDCLKKELSRIAIEKSGIGNLVNYQSFDNFDLSYYSKDQKEAQRMKGILAFIKSYAEGFNENTHTNLLFVGKTGLGKTHLSTACAKLIIEKGYEVVYDTVQNIINDFEYERFGREYNSEPTEKKTDKYFDSDLLIVDDLGTEITNVFTVSVIYNLINTRINNKKPMIINTNLPSNEIQSRYDSRIVSRIFGEFDPCPFYGTDIRSQKKA